MVVILDANIKIIVVSKSEDIVRSFAGSLIAKLAMSKDLVLVSPI